MTIGQFPTYMLILASLRRVSLSMTMQPQLLVPALVPCDVVHCYAALGVWGHRTVAANRLLSPLSPLHYLCLLPSCRGQSSGRRSSASCTPQCLVHLLLDSFRSHAQAALICHIRDFGQSRQRVMVIEGLPISSCALAECSQYTRRLVIHSSCAGKALLNPSRPLSRGLG